MATLSPLWDQAGSQDHGSWGLGEAGALSPARLEVCWKHSWLEGSACVFSPGTHTTARQGTWGPEAAAGGCRWLGEAPDKELLSSRLKAEL